MWSFKSIYYALIISLVCLGCSSSTGSEGGGDDGNGDNGGNETTEYSLSVTAEPSDGGSVEPADSTYEEGTDVTVEATPKQGWAFDGWTGDRESNENPLSFTINEDNELTANFIDTTAEDSTQFNLSAVASPMAGGIVEPTDGVYDEGAEVTIEAFPNDGWKFDGWIGDLESSENPLVFEITEDTELTAQFSDTTSDEPTEYSLAVSTSPEGGGTVSPSSGTYDEGAEVIVEATPNSGYKFDGWTGDQESEDNPLTFTINQDSEITANFKDTTASKGPTTYNLSVSADPSAGGSLSPSSGTYEEGTEVTVEAIPNTHWEFTRWSGDLGHSLENPLSFTINSDIDITASFEKVEYSFTASTDPRIAGTVEPSVGSYKAGANITFEATPNDGWKFAGWSGDSRSNENPLTITLTEDLDLKADFVERTRFFNLSTTVEPTGGGQIDPYDGTYEEGSQVIVEASPNDGWVFKEWTGDRQSTDNPLVFNINGNTDIKANFTEVHDLSVTESPAEGGSVRPSPGQYESGKEVRLVATPDEGWKFDGWTGDKSSSHKTFIFTMTDDIKVTANFSKKEYNVSVRVLPQQGGSVEPGDGIYEYGSEISLEATPASGWKFTGWTGDIESVGNPLNLTIGENIRLDANFEEAQSNESFFSVAMTAFNGEESFDLSFGKKSGATRIFDNGLDRYAPPPPPNNEFYTYFIVNSIYLFDDFRPSSHEQAEEWRLKYQLGSEDQFELNWDVTDDTNMPGSLILTDQNNSFEVNMLNQASYSISTSQSGELLIKYHNN